MRSPLSKQTIDRLAALDPQDPVTPGLVSRAQAAIADGRLKEADQLLDRAEQIEEAGAHQAQQLVQQAQGRSTSGSCGPPTQRARGAT